MARAILTRAGALLRSVHRALGLKYRLDRWRGYVRRFGVRGALRTHRRIWSSGDGVREVSVAGLPHPVLIRPATADASTFEHIFIWNDYELDYPAGVRTIVDAGANIGLSAVYFANRFPDATIVAIEPQADNYELLRRNVLPYPAIVPLRAALWSHDTTLGLSNPRDRVDSYRYSATAEEQAVEAFAIPSILERFGVPTLDVLKIDIEGAETEVFAASDSWIDRVRMFVIELHGDEARAAFTAATARVEALRYRRGENDVVITEPRER